MSTLYPRVILLLVLSLTLAACGGAKTSEGVFPQDHSRCAPSAIPNQFIVHRTDGSSEVHSNISREQLLKEVVEPELESIRRVDYDRHIELPQVSLGVANTIGTNAIVTHSQYSDWGVTASAVQDAWSRGIYGAGSVVAVIDTGVDYIHHQLSNQILYNSGEQGLDANGRDKRFNGIDDDGNGYVDDWVGYNFAYGDEDPQDSTSHGTHVAGIIAAEHKAGIGAQGIAPQSKIIPIAFIPRNGLGSLSSALAALEYAAQRGAHIINASWGGVSCAPSLGEKISSLNERGILFISASGNRGIDIERRPEFPASFNMPLQITVGSVGRALGMADHSNYGIQTVHIFSPGVEILSTVPNQSLGYMTGTSMATPFVSGALALLRSHRPTATASELKQALLSSVVTSSSYLNATSGRLHIGRALNYLESLVPAPVHQNPR